MNDVLLDPAGSLQLAAAIQKTPLSVPAGRIPVMAFVADAETEAILSSSMPQLNFPNAAIIRGGIDKAIQHLNGDRSPTTLIVDISGTALPVSRIHELAEVCEPGVTVIAIGDHNDVGLYRDLMQAGLTDYIVKPVTPHLLAKALKVRTAAGSGRISQKRAKVIALVGARGGVGATTFAVNLAWYFAERHKRRVALVDLDLQYGECGYLLNIEPTPGLREALTNPLRIDGLFLERTLAQHGENLFVLSCEEPVDAEVQFTGGAVETLVAALHTQFHYVIVDVSRNSAASYRRALELADLRVIVTDQTLRAVRDAVRLHRSLGDGLSAHRNLVVVNRSGEAGRRGVTLAEMKSVLEAPLSCVVPFEPKLFHGAASQSDMAAARRGKFSEAISAMAQELSGRRSSERRVWWRRTP